MYVQQLSERYKHMVRLSLAVFPAAGLQIKFIFGKDLKSVQFHLIKKCRRCKIEVYVTNIFNISPGLHNLGLFVIGHVKCFDAEITFMQACHIKI